MVQEVLKFYKKHGSKVAHVFVAHGVCRSLRDPSLLQTQFAQFEMFLQLHNLITWKRTSSCISQKNLAVAQ